jgi:hypothetical protein
MSQLKVGGYGSPVAGPKSQQKCSRQTAFWQAVWIFFFTAIAPLEPHSRRKLYPDPNVGFLISGEKSNVSFASARAPAMGTLLTVTTDSLPAT